MSPLPELFGGLVPFCGGASCEKSATEAKVSRTDARQHRRIRYIRHPRFETEDKKLCIRLDITGIPGSLLSPAVTARIKSCILPFTCGLSDFPSPNCSYA